MKSKINDLKTEQIIIEKIINEQEVLDYIFSFIILIGSIGFLLVGISTYVKYNLVPFIKTEQIIFFPQGLTMSFYGICGIILSLYQLITIYLEIGQGYNEYNKETGTITIFRKGYPGKNSEITLRYKIEDILRMKKLFQTHFN